MKRIIYSLALTAVIATALTACRTTEANYAAAYHIARQKQDAPLSSEEIEGLRREQAIQRTLYRGDSIPLKGMYVKHVEGAQPGRYTVVVATFRQLFNSRSVFTRLKDAGGEWADPLILQSPGDQRYYVGAVTSDSLDVAVDALHALQHSSPVQLASPCPFILSR